jgi:hypothetical protein
MVAVFENICKVFGYQGLNKFQIEAITHILEKGIDNGIRQICNPSFL